MKAIPLLFLSDSVDLSTGLARITRDLAGRVARHLRFEVACLGRGGLGGLHSHYGHCYRSYVIPHTTVGHGWDEWGVSVIERVWRDFAGDQRGVLMTVWDATRLLPYACPRYLPEGRVRDFLLKRPFKLWGYFPVDGECEDGALGSMAGETLSGYDRVVGYGQYGMQRLLAAKAGPLQTDAIPHGIDTSVFSPRPREVFRRRAGVPDNAYLVGCVMTNQARKDWGLAARIGAMLRTHIPNLRLWWHVDELEREWSIPALLHAYKLADITSVSLEGDDDFLAHAYSACDLTLLPSLGEGFGYPIVESMACGTPCIHGDYAGGAELTPLLVPPATWRIEGLSGTKRPVFEPEAWVKKVLWLHEAGYERNAWRERAMAYSWEQVWPKWEQWFKTGLEAL